MEVVAAHEELQLCVYFVCHVCVCNLWVCTGYLALRVVRWCDDCVGEHQGVWGSSFAYALAAKLKQTCCSTSGDYLPPSDLLPMDIGSSLYSHYVTLPKLSLCHTPYTLIMSHSPLPTGSALLSPIHIILHVHRVTLPINGVLLLPIHCVLSPIQCVIHPSHS